MSHHLSHSSLARFQTCPTSWKHHYVSRIRPKRLHAALNFGSAIDAAIGALVENSDDAESVFDKLWRFQYVNSVETYLPTSIDIVYAKTDFDIDLIDQTKLATFDLTLKQIKEAIDYKNDKGFDNIPDEIKVICNVGYWLTLHTKGLLMIEAFRKKVLPKFNKIHSTQEKIELENDEGDKIIGFVDLVCEVKDYGNVVLDVKTSAREYEDNSVKYSPQLTLYVNSLSEKYNTRKAGFIVLSKQIIKNKTKICSVCKYDGSEGRAKTCDQEKLQMVESKKGPTEKMVRCNGEWNESIKPEAWVQFLIDEIPAAAEQLVMQNIQDINDAIKHGVFTKNLSKCLDNYGKPCEFLSLCYEGKMDGLVYQEKK